ncbi:peptidoglycan-binding domain-containing protein [Pseudactinotalea sp. HY158]|uniref:peptidoglycan-binding domain-containing protein n=1 Tax=unclassified Pseudactinotalea TaxID=2649176 RepID=UPI0018846CE1|nr:peptidoglycan-binding domain-containing protein [Pseudactinotalea sp. HY158]
MPVITALALALASGFGLSRLTVTPENAIVPESIPEPVWAEVTNGTLSGSHTGTGTVVAPEQVPINIRAGERTPVVTSQALAPGEQVRACGILVEISDRPLFALPGEIPAYRDLVQGDGGEDVARLQSALRECGYQIAADGVFGPETAATVRLWYRDNGYRVVEREEMIELSEPAMDGVAIETDDAPASRASAARKLVVVPANEIEYIREGAVVTEVVPVGTVVDDPVLHVSDGSYLFEVELKPAVRFDLQEGQETVLDLGGTSITVPLPTLPSEPTTGSAGEPVFVLRLQLPQELDPGSVGSTGTYTVATGTDEVFDRIVPVTAVRTDPSGRTYVVKAVAGSDPVAVEVTGVAAEGGYVAVDGDLQYGDRLWLTNEIH